MVKKFASQFYGMAVRLRGPSTERDASTRDIVVEILGGEFPLSAKRIHSIAANQHGKRVTYHAVYKAINALLKEKAVAKQGLGYSLSENYIREICDFASRASALYKNEKTGILSSLQEGGCFTKKVDNQLEIGAFVLDILNQCEKDEVIAIIWATIWPTMENFPEINSKIKEIASKTKKVYIVSGTESLFDSILAKRWQQLGVKIKVGVNLSSVFEIFAFRDFVVLVLQPKDRRFGKYKYLDLLKHQELTRLFNFYLANFKEKTSNTRCIVIRNRIMADIIKEEVLSQF